MCMPSRSPCGITSFSACRMPYASSLRDATTRPSLRRGCTLRERGCARGTSACSPRASSANTSRTLSSTRAHRVRAIRCSPRPQSPQADMGPRDWPIIVGGCHRSGTSVVRRVLDAHGRIHCGPEIKFFRDFYGDYPDDSLRDFRFVQTARAVLPADELLEVVGRAFVEVHERAAHHAGKPRWADKAPENVLHTREWERLLGDRWFLVHVV